MLSQLFGARLKAAEKALKGGRLDEAYRLATAPDIRAHRRGSAVLSKLSEQFIERARRHYRAERFAEALMDLDKAETGANNRLIDQAAELRRQVQTVAAEVRRQEHSQRARLADAKRRISGGSLAAGRRILEQASASDPSARKLQQEAEHRKADLQRLLEQAERLQTEGSHLAASRLVRKARQLDKNNERLIRTEIELRRRIVDGTRGALRGGRLGRAASEISALDTLGATHPEAAELAQLVRVSQEAARCFQEHDPTGAKRHILSLQRLMPDAPWVKATLGQLKQLGEIEDTIRSGPLGERTPPAYTEQNPTPATPSPGETRVTHRPAKRPAMDDTMALPSRTEGEGALPLRLLLLVDGGGSFLLLRGPRASIGRAASAHPADIGLFSDISEQHANIDRVDEDYFLFGSKELVVSGNKTRHQLLRDGDRIVLGRKAKLTFRLPSRMSSSGVLDLSDTTKMPNDVRRVVLFQRLATLGEGPHVHIRCRPAGPPLVLFERNDELWIRQKSDGHVDHGARRLSLGTTVELGGVSLVLEPWEVRPPGLTGL